MLLWVSYLHVLCICTCSVQLSMFHMERHSNYYYYAFIITILKRQNMAHKARTRIFHLSLLAVTSSTVFRLTFTALPPDWSVLSFVFGLSLLLCPLGLQNATLSNTRKQRWNMTNLTMTLLLFKVFALLASKMQLYTRKQSWNMTNLTMTLLIFQIPWLVIQHRQGRFTIFTCQTG